MSGPILFTRNLILRPLNGEDFEPWVAFHADEEAMRFLGGVQNRATAWRGICAMAGAWSVRGFSMFSVIERATGRWVGRVGPWQPEGWPGREVAWGVASEFAGRGYAYEAAAASMDYAVDVLGWDHVIHTIDPDNVRSIRLAERLGSVNQGPTRCRRRRSSSGSMPGDRAPQPGGAGVRRIQSPAPDNRYSLPARGRTRWP